MSNDTDDRRDENESRRRSRSDCGSSGRRNRDGRRRRRKRHDGERSREDRHARKEKVLHTRISEQLAEDIRKFADDVRVPASNLVRNVLEEVFTVVDSVSDDVGDIMDDLASEAEGVRDRVWRQARGRSRRRYAQDSDADVEAEFRRDEDAEATTDEPAEEAASSEPPRPPASELFPDVLGWQPLVLNRDMQCGRCELTLSAGESAFLGMGGGGLTETALCGPCASGSAGRGR